LELRVGSGKMAGKSRPEGVSPKSPEAPGVSKGACASPVPIVTPPSGANGRALYINKSESTSRLGITLDGDVGPPTITSIAADGLANGSGLNAGDTLLSVNGVAADGHEATTALLKQGVGEIELLVRAGVQSAAVATTDSGRASSMSPSSASTGGVTLVINKLSTKSRLGLTLDGDVGHPTIVAIAEDGLASGTALQVGDTILSVNGAAADGHEATTALLKKASGKVKLLVLQSSVEAFAPPHGNVDEASRSSEPLVAMAEQLPVLTRPALSEAEAEIEDLINAELAESANGLGVMDVQEVDSEALDLLEEELASL
jgi:membrane-associated protease RseP (regulator of RpoE activity)